MKSKPKNNLYAILTTLTKQNKSQRKKWQMLLFQTLKSTNLWEFDKGYCYGGLARRQNKS